MHHITRILFPGLATFFTFLLLFSCATTPGEREADRIRSELEQDKVYYLKHSLHLQRNNYHSTINYYGRRVIPMGTKVLIRRISEEVIVGVDPSVGASFTILNEIEYSRQSIGQVFQRSFSREPVETRSIQSPEFRLMIHYGGIKPGMTRQEVVMALGYPPYHETESIRSDRWRYWTSRKHSRVLVFDANGYLSEIID